MSVNRRNKYPDTATFHWHNANPKNRVTAADCVIRAIALTSDRSWDDTLLGLTEVALKMKRVPNEPECYGRYLESLGFRKMPQPKKPDGTKLTGSEFCSDVLSVKYGGFTVVANMPGHAVCCMEHEGRFKVWDTWDSSDRTIGVFWVK